jgi:hypothetical protein
MFPELSATVKSVGISNSGLLSLAFPTAEATFQAFLCSAGNGFRKLIGNYDGSA